MKRFLLFGGGYYSADGGWCDFKGSFDSIEEAQSAALADKDLKWFHVADVQTASIVREGSIN